MMSGVYHTLITLQFSDIVKIEWLFCEGCGAFHINWNVVKLNLSPSAIEEIEVIFPLVLTFLQTYKSHPKMEKKFYKLGIDPPSVLD